MKRDITTIVVLILLFSSVAIVGIFSSPIDGKSTRRAIMNNNRGYIVHSTIKINNDTDFANQASQEGWLGNGTENDPYIISVYDVTNGAKDAIYIGNTTVYFVVENCYLHGSSNGIVLYRVINGKITNNKILNNRYGIVISYSSDSYIISTTLVLTIVSG